MKKHKKVEHKKGRNQQKLNHENKLKTEMKNQRRIKKKSNNDGTNGTTRAK